MATGGKYYDCTRCKGADLVCGRPFCPILLRVNSYSKTKKKIKENFQGSAPSVFVGRFGYPKINLGLLSPGEIVEDASLYDDPRRWAEEKFELQKVVDIRTSLLNSRIKVGVKDQKDRFLQMSQEAAMTIKPVDAEINLKKVPSFNVSFDSVGMPMGPSARLKKAKLTSNPKVHTKVDKVVSDTDLKSGKAMEYLYKNEFDENFLSRILSVGTLGVKKDRKLVPTRWAITAVDDSLAKHKIDEIKDFQSIDEYQLFIGSNMGNIYFIMLFPDVWSHELFEIYLPKSAWNPSDKPKYCTDHEFYEGRKTYAENCVGGYYAARLPVLNYLKKIRKQATILSVRFETPEYWASLGVWVVREAARRTMSAHPMTFESKEKMLDFVSDICSKKFKYDLNPLFKESKLLDRMKNQFKLTKFV
ncbi:hypothetical protein ACFLZ7_00600 [Nanoarchaeota archaeon]